MRSCMTGNHCMYAVLVTCPSCMITYDFCSNQYRTEWYTLFQLNFQVSTQCIKSLCLHNQLNVLEHNVYQATHDTRARSSRVEQHWACTKALYIIHIETQLIAGQAFQSHVGSKNKFLGGGALQPYGFCKLNHLLKMALSEQMSCVTHYQSNFINAIESFFLKTVLHRMLTKVVVTKKGIVENEPQYAAKLLFMGTQCPPDCDFLKVRQEKFILVFRMSAIRIRVDA